MDDLILRYYDAEMRYLLEASEEFARAHPEQAAMLNLDKAGTRDPYVERLFEGFAFLMGRLREKLDDDLPELTEGLVSLLWPHYLRTIPSMSVVEFTPDWREMKEQMRIDKGFEVNSRPIGEKGTRCRYTITKKITLQPLSLERASLVIDTNGRSVVTLHFNCSQLADWNRIDLSHIPFCFNADALLACAMHEAFTLNVARMWLRMPGDMDRIQLKGKRMAAEGFYLVQGDKTTCGEKITTGAEDHTLFDKPVSREQDSVTCGKHAGLFRIADGIDNDTIHDRRMAGTLDSYSTCPCRAKFIPSMMDDTYEKSGGSANSAGGTTAATATSSATTPPVTTTGQSSDLKSKLHCRHTDGAIKVADYILNEIKTNVRGRIANVIRGYIDDETMKNTLKEWNNLPFYAKLAPRPEPHLSEAIIVWYQTVKTGSVWDHKPKIRDMFGSVAVARPLPGNTPSKSYYHKYKHYDYFYDVWSNIHYGYVGLSVGFKENLLLSGSIWEQNMTPGAVGNDTLDDVTSMKIGFSLYHRHGKMADTLTTQDILNALDSTAEELLPVSKQKHWCWNNKNPKKIEP